MRVSPGFCLLTLWFGTVNGWELLLKLLLAAALHELGHCLALLLAGGRITALRLETLGAVLETECGGMSYPQELLAVAAGPAVNLAGALLASDPLTAGIHLCLGLFNLLPLYPLDGGRLLYLALCWAAGPEWGERGRYLAGGLSAAALMCAIIYIVLRSSGSLWLLITAAGALAAAGRLIWGEYGAK